MLVLKINPIVGFVANYLYLVLGYLGKFLYYKTLTGWPWGNLLKNIYIYIYIESYSGHCDTTRRDPLTGPINNAYSDSGYKLEPFSIPQAQSEQQEQF